MRTLRSWQAECVQAALTTFQTRDHFFCHATPGAGKTVMVASLARALVEDDEIDFVICFSPSVSVAENMAKTFEKILEKRFDGKIGASGASLTYQAMNNIPEKFWSLLSEYRVLVVLDEIHHCAGYREEEFVFGNSWGREILRRIQGHARFTIALSGTPWRSDDMPIALAPYSQDFLQCAPDYQYGLNAAIADGVCRSPKIVLVDNQDIRLQSPDDPPERFESIAHSLEAPQVNFRHYLDDREVIDHLLKEANEKLSEIRKHTPDAGALVVASSVTHAHQIAKQLRQLGESPDVVTYETPGAQQVIAKFSANSSRWIVSVGMISEGTDIPRLQVCCHLSRVRTELHFRQLLGRILRLRPTEKQYSAGWLYVLAEPSLSKFAHRINEEIPGKNLISLSHHSSGQLATSAPKEEAPDVAQKGPEFDLDLGQFGARPSTRSELDIDHGYRAKLSLSNQYWHQVVSLFNQQQ